MVANDAQVWELLSGKPATFGQSEESPDVLYEKWKLQREWFNAADLGKEIHPKIGAVKTNRKLDNLGYIERKDGGWVPTQKSKDSGFVRERGGSSIYDDKPCVELNRNLIQILQDN